MAHRAWGMGTGDKRRKSTGVLSSAPRLRLTWMVSGGRATMVTATQSVREIASKVGWAEGSGVNCGG